MFGFEHLAHCCQQRIRKILVSVKIIVRNSGAGNGCANFMDAWKNACFLQENLHVHKIVRLGGDLGFWGGGECRFYFYGHGDFSEKSGSLQHYSTRLPVMVPVAVPVVVGPRVGQAAARAVFSRSCFHTKVHRRKTQQLPWNYSWIWVFGFRGGFLHGFFQAIFLGEQPGNIHRKNHPNHGFFHPNPLREISALKQSCKVVGPGGKLRRTFNRGQD